jgi:hypothetical protein
MKVNLLYSFYVYFANCGKSVINLQPQHSQIYIKSINQNVNQSNWTASTWPNSYQVSPSLQLHPVPCRTDSATMKTTQQTVQCTDGMAPVMTTLLNSSRTNCRSSQISQKMGKHCLKSAGRRTFQESVQRDLTGVESGTNR